MLKNLNGQLILLLAAVMIIFSIGCGERKTGDDKPEQTNGEADTTAIEEEVVKVPDITGTWTGSFDRRATTLKITEQDSSTFKGNITINYRDVINQQVSGKIDLEKNTFTMNDLLHHRFAGSYVGSISEEYATMEGTFTGKTDNRKVQFNLKRKL
jgi:hypothetical protein